MLTQNARERARSSRAQVMEKSGTPPLLTKNCPGGEMSGRRDALVDLLSAGFGLGSWIAMTGLWVELPLLVQRLPEGWTLASQLALTLQVANAGPVLYGLFQRWWPAYVNERSATHFQLAIGSLSTFLLVFMWTWTIGGRSIAFFVLAFGLSVVDCTSSVVWLPYMARFRSCYLTPYLMGEGFSGLIPSLIALAQGIENAECVNVTRTVFSEHLGVNVSEVQLVPYIRDPHFEPEWFFTILLAMVLLSWASFILLDKLPRCRKEKMKHLKQGMDAELHEMQRNTNEVVPEEEYEKESTTLYWYLLFLQGWASLATFGIFPPIQPFSCLPYGDTAFHLTVTLCGVAYPAACLLAMFVEVREISRISWMSLAATLFSIYPMTTAVMSPLPPFKDTQAGAIFVVVCWVTFVFIFSYVKTMVTVLMGDLWGQRALFWCGAVTQGGAVVGTLLMFLLVNVLHVFHDEGMCIV